MKKNSNTFKRLAGVLMAFGGLFSTSPGTAIKTTMPVQVQQDAIPQKHSTPKPTTRRKESIPYNPFRYHKTPKKNQRQKRRFMRQNPHLRGTKKSCL